MAFERFTKVGGRSYAPKVSIWAKGQMGFNKGAVSKWDLDKYGYAVLFYDRESKLIGIKFTNDEKEEGAIKVVRRPSGISFSANSLLQYYDISVSGTEKFDVRFDKETELYIIDLSKRESAE